MLGLYHLRKRKFPEGSASDPVLLYLVSGTFTRTTSGSYHNGSTSSIAWAVPNVLRYEDRGDGYGELALLEGARTNVFNFSRNPSSINNRTATAAVTASFAVSPDGLMSGTRYQLTGTQFADNSALTKTSGVLYAHSLFVRSGEATTNFQLLVSNENIAFTSTIDTTWRRADVVRAASATSNGGLVPIDARNWASVGGQAAQSIDAVIDMMQVEVGSFPSSFIQTTSATDVARGSDTLSFPSGTYSPEIHTNGFEVKIYPEASSNELIAGSQTTYGITSFDSSIGFLAFLVTAGTNIRIRYFEPVFGQRVVSSDLIFNRHQEISIGFYPNSGSGTPRIVVSGASSGNGNYSGSALALSSTGTLYIGNTYGTSNYLFGRISNFYRSGTLGL
jgi:hypothetical protein